MVLGTLDTKITKQEEGHEAGLSGMMGSFMPLLPLRGTGSATRPLGVCIGWGVHRGRDGTHGALPVFDVEDGVAAALRQKKKKRTPVERRPQSSLAAIQ